MSDVLVNEWRTTDDLVEYIVDMLNMSDGGFGYNSLLNDLSFVQGVQEIDGDGALCLVKHRPFKDSFCIPYEECNDVFDDDIPF